MHFNIGTWMVIISWLFFCLSCGMLIFSLKKNKFRLLNGVLGNSALLLLGAAVSFTIMYSQIYFLERALTIAAVIIIVPLALLYFSMGFLLLWNAAIVWRKESHSLGNMLTLIIGICLILSPLFSRVVRSFLSPYVTSLLFGLIGIVVFYFVFWLGNFITSFLITRLFRPRWNKKYIIVLGSGLIGGSRVSPLLASRIMKAKEFGEQQFQKNGLRPLIIFSGGQGPDEKLPEGQAMKDYGLAHGMQDFTLIAETKSKNTYQNMLFSKQILEEKQIDLKAGLFATSDYHTFRAAGYARYVGLDIDGIGAKTSKFFIPNAFLREYIAILMNHKFFHLSMLSILVIIDIFASWGFNVK